MIVLSFMNCSQSIWVVILLTISVGLIGLNFGSVLSNGADIAPPHAGIIVAIANTAATITGIITPYIAASLTTNVSQILSLYKCIIN